MVESILLPHGRGLYVSLWIFQTKPKDLQKISSPQGRERWAPLSLKATQRTITSSPGITQAVLRTTLYYIMIKHKGWPNWLNHQMEYWNDETIKVCLMAGSWSLYNPYDMTTCWAPTTSNPVSTVLEPKLLASNLICDAAVLRAAWSMGCWKGMEAVNSTALISRPLQQAKPHMPELALGPSSYAGIAVHLEGWEGRDSDQR